MRRALVAVPIAGCAGAAAQSPATGSFSLTPAHQADSALDSGGNVGYTAVYTTLGEGWTLDPAARAETRLRGLAL
jgi:hypothetical protein